MSYGVKTCPNIHKGVQRQMQEQLRHHCAPAHHQPITALSLQALSSTGTVGAQAKGYLRKGSVPVSRYDPHHGRPEEQLHTPFQTMDMLP